MLLRTSFVKEGGHVLPFFSVSSESALYSSGHALSSSVEGREMLVLLGFFGSLAFVVGMVRFVEGLFLEA